jgi:hypothetical protein
MLDRLADVQHSAVNVDAARTAWRQSLTIFDDLDCASAVSTPYGPESTTAVGSTSKFCGYVRTRRASAWSARGACRARPSSTRVSVAGLSGSWFSC